MRQTAEAVAPECILTTAQSAKIDRWLTHKYATTPPLFSPHFLDFKRPDSGPERHAMQWQIPEFVICYFFTQKTHNCLLRQVSNIVCVPKGDESRGIVVRTGLEHPATKTTEIDHQWLALLRSLGTFEAPLALLRSLYQFSDASVIFLGAFGSFEAPQALRRLSQVSLGA